jgi:hypothetical protein
MITSQEKQWFKQEGELCWNVGWVIIDPTHRMGAQLGRTTYEFLKKHGFEFQNFDTSVFFGKKVGNTFPWYIDIVEKTIHPRWNAERREGQSVYCLPTQLVEFCKVPRNVAKLQARNLGLI